MNELRIGTDCSGIEAPIQALLQLNIPFHHVFSSEIDKYAIKTCKANYSEPDIRYSDLTKRDHNLLPDIDLYVCGFPCQSFSGLGKKRGMADSRSNIMFHCIEVIKIKQPKFFILENVRGFMSNNNGDTMKLLLSELEGVNYTVHYKLLNTKDFGLPQNRPRIYFVGIRNDLDISFNFPETLLKSTCIDDLMINKKRNEIFNFSKSLYKHFITIKDPTENWFIIDSGFKSATKDYTPTLTTNCKYIYSTKYNRFLTTEECLLLQGFPKDFHQCVSNCQMFRQIGNSMSVPILKYIHQLF